MTTVCPHLRSGDIDCLQAASIASRSHARALRETLSKWWLMRARRTQDALAQLFRALVSISNDVKPSVHALAASSQALKTAAHRVGASSPWMAPSALQTWNNRRFSSAVDACDDKAHKDAAIKTEARLAMVFTCTKCDTRSVKTFSKIAYTRGLVLVRCPGCEKLHLVSDHLGWFGAKGWTIEDLALEAGVKVKMMREPSHDPTTTATGTATTMNQPAFEDWAGWSRVQSLLGVAAGPDHQQQKQERAGATEGDGPQLNGVQDLGAGGNGVGSLSAKEEVWEVDPGDLDRWRKVRDGV